MAVRADAAPEIGTGHIMRCLALAQAWRRKRGTVRFYAAWLPPTLRDRLEREGFEVCPVHPDSMVGTPGTDMDVGSPAEPAPRSEAERFADSARRDGAVWVVLDGYRFDAGYQDAIVAAGHRVLVIDDHGHVGRYPAHIVLDQNLDTDPGRYRDTAPGTRRLLGSSYILLREEFRTARQSRNTTAAPQEPEIFVTLGGAPPAVLLREVLRGVDAACQDVAEGTPSITVLAGALDAGTRAQLVEGLAARTTFLPPDADVAQAMARATVAVSAGGTTAWELAHLGVPTMLVARAENQRPVCRALAAHGAARDLGPVDALDTKRLTAACLRLLQDADTRAAMAEAGQRLVDGHGTGRILFWMKEALLEARRATADDSRMVWTWANDPETRAVSYTPDPIPWEGHDRWFQGRIKDPAMRLLMITLDPLAAGTDAPLPVAFFRLEPDPDQKPPAHVVSINVAPEHRDLGIGPAAIHLACREASGDPEVGRILAYIKPDNPRSQKAFARAGFARTGTTTLQDAPACIYSYVGLEDDAS